jgi:hypothetical protein
VLAGKSSVTMQLYPLSQVNPPIALGKQNRMAKDRPRKGSKMPYPETAFDPVSAALQQLHQAVASEELPEDFLRILEDIDAKIAAAKPAAKQ